MLRLLAGALALAFLTGCAGYKLGPTDGHRAGDRTIQVNPFSNQTLEPRLSEALTQALRKTLQQDGTFRLNTSNDADVILSGTILRFDRQEISFQPRDTLTPREYRILMLARITARDRVTGRTLFDRNVNGRTSLFVGNDLPSAERQAIPLLAEDLARNATALLVDGEW